MYIAHFDENGNIQTVSEHCKNVAEYCANFLSPINLYNTGLLLGLLHDAGKYSDAFQNYIRNDDGVKGSVIHTFAAPRYLLNMQNTDRFVVELISSVISCHHGLIDNIINETASELAHRENTDIDNSEQSMQRFLQDCVSESYIIELIEKSTQEIHNFVTEIINTEPNEGKSRVSSLYLYLCSVLMDADRSDTAEFTYKFKYPKYEPDWQHYNELILNKLSTFNYNTEINRCRKEMSDYCFDFAKQPDGIYKLPLMVGAGKTLSSLRYAIEHCRLYNKKKVIYCAPYLSIVDQNAKEIREVLQNSPDILEQHSNIVLKDESEKFLYHLNTDRWDAPIIITTTMQLLEILLATDTTHLRKLHALYDSVIILDESQNIPDKLISLFNAQCNFLSKYCKTTILLCSATNPTFENVEHALAINDANIIPKQQLDYYKSVFKRTTYTHLGELSLTQIADFINDKMEAEVQSFVAIFNTKTEAQTVYNLINSNDNVFKYHLSANMCAKHRLKVINEIKLHLAQKHKVICISTQVIEAGVDISFECGLRSEAGVDRIVQCGGRINRNAEYGRICNLYIVRVQNQKLGSLNDILLSQKHLHYTLNKFDASTLDTDDSVQYYFDKYLKDDAINLNYFVEIDLHRYELYDLFVGEGKTYNHNFYLNHELNIWLTQKFKTIQEHLNIFENNCTPIIVPYEDGVNIIEELQSDKAKDNMSYRCSLLDSAKLCIVNVYNSERDKLLNIEAVKYLFDNTVAILTSPQFYDDSIGILSSNAIENLALIL